MNLSMPVSIVETVIVQCLVHTNACEVQLGMYTYIVNTQLKCLGI